MVLNTGEYHYGPWQKTKNETFIFKSIIANNNKKEKNVRCYYRQEIYF